MIRAMRPTRIKVVRRWERLLAAIDCSHWMEQNRAWGGIDLPQIGQCL